MVAPKRAHPPDADERLTPAVEEYLETIYHLGNEGTPVIGARLAERLAVASPTVTTMLQRLQQQGLLTLSEHKAVVLTEQGHRLALSIARRHYIAERFLVDLLGLPWHLADQEAHRLEHALSPEVERRLSELLGHPTTCPHGSPIPGSGLPTAPKGVPLSRAPTGVPLVVERITERGEEDVRLLEFYWRHGLVPGAALTVVEAAAYSGTLTVRAGERDTVMGFEAASHVLVLPAGGD